MPRFYKLLAPDLCHHGFTYQEGLNVDTLPFDPSGDCKPGGLYYTTLEHLPHWYCAYWSRIADVTVPCDAQVYEEPCGTKWKADKLVLSNIRPLREFFKTLDEDTKCEMLARNAETLECMENQTEAMCLVALLTSGFALEWVKNQTEELCLAAVKQNGHALYYVQNQTEAVCRAAVARFPYARQYVKIPIDF